MKFLSGGWVEWAKSGMYYVDKIQKAVTDMFQWIIDWIGDHIPAWMKKLSYEGGGFGGGGGIIRTSYGGGGGGHPALGGGSGGGVPRFNGAMGNVPIGSPGSNPILQAIHRAAAGNTNVERIMLIGMLDKRLNVCYRLNHGYNLPNEPS
jgi:hypothetical protein